MYQEMHKWDLSIKVAEMKNHPEIDNLKRNYFQWLVDSGQEEKAGHLKEEDGDYSAAISLYLKGGLAGKAASLLLQHELQGNFELTERVAASLFKSGLFEKAGELYEHLGSSERALDAYKKGKCFRAAVEQCRTTNPSEVVKLEEQWGDYLMQQKQTDGAINHYIEAGKSLKALDAAMQAKQWKKAVNIVDTLDSSEKAGEYLLKLADYFKSVGETEYAERYYVESGRTKDAVDMYFNQAKYDKAYSLALSTHTKSHVHSWYSKHAKDLEEKGKYLFLISSTNLLHQNSRQLQGRREGVFDYW